MVEIEIGDLLFTVFDANWPKSEKNLSPHFHPMFELQYSLKNHFVLKTAEAGWFVEEESYAVIPPNYFHWTEYGEEEFDRYSFLFSISFANKVSHGVSEYRHYNAILENLKEIMNKKNHIVSDCIRHIIALEEDRKQLNEHKLKIYFSMLFLLVSDDVSSAYPVDFTQDGSVKSDTPEKRKMREEICEYVTHNYHKDYILHEIAERWHMSQRNVGRIVKELFGVSLSALVLNQRMNCAWGFITETEQSLQDIAEKIGYHSYNAFFKAFKSYYGFAPENLRK